MLQTDLQIDINEKMIEKFPNFIQLQVKSTLRLRYDYVGQENVCLKKIKRVIFFMHISTGSSSADTMATLNPNYLVHARCRDSDLEVSVILSIYYSYVYIYSSSNRED